MRIDMFVYNRCTTDARVLKEAASLASAGHDVRIVAVLDGTTVPEEERTGFRVVRIDRNPVHYRLLAWMRRVTGGLRLGATAVADAADRSRPASRGGRLLLAPLLLLRELASVLWRIASVGLRGTESAVRRLLLVPHKPLMFLDYYRRAYRLVLADPPDALHAHDLNTMPVAAALARRLRIGLIYDAHELYPEISTLSDREAAVWRFLERRLAKRATSIVTVCESIAGEIERRYDVRRPMVLLNCPSFQRPALPGASLQAFTGVDEGEPIVLYQGGFAPHRGLETLVLAAREIERGQVVLMGWGNIEEDLNRLIRREGLTDRVRIVAPVPRDEIVAHASGAAVGVIPYEPVGLNNTYTTPNKLFDYMAAGLPIVATRLPELVRFVEGNEIGVTFEPGEPHALASAVNELIADPARGEAIRANALEAGERYTWERESTKLLEIYEGTPPGRAHRR